METFCIETSVSAVLESNHFLEVDCPFWFINSLIKNGLQSDPSSAWLLGYRTTDIITVLFPNKDNGHFYPFLLAVKSGYD